MRRWINATVIAVTFAAAMAVGPLGAGAAPPYVYGCTPAQEFNSATLYSVSLSIYNGSSSTANLTHKILAGNGTILNSIFAGALALPVTSTLGPTDTAVFAWGTVAGFASKTDGTVPASIRIVSNAPISATYSHDVATGNSRPVVCLPQQP
jgi:hypothetical protein